MASSGGKVARRIQRAIEGDVVEPVRYQAVLHHVNAYVRSNPPTKPGYWREVEDAVKAALLKGYTLRDQDSAKGGTNDQA